MKIENEITVMVNSDYHTLHNSLINNNFVIKEWIVLGDLYIINGKVDITQLNKLEVLKHYILIRSINEIKHFLLYKYKEYDENSDILKQGKIECPVTDINQAISFMEAINYKKIFNINDKCIVYTNNKTELAVQIVNDKYIFIEM